MERRTFIRLVAGSVVALPAGLFLVQCGSDSTSSDAPGAPPRRSGTQTVYTSSSNVGHTHTFGVDDSAYVTPPTAGVMGDTSTDSGHNHAVSISIAILQSVATGQSVKVTTAAGGAGHTHVLTLVKIA